MYRQPKESEKFRSGRSGNSRHSGRGHSGHSGHSERPRREHSGGNLKKEQTYRWGLGAPRAGSRAGPHDYPSIPPSLYTFIEPTAPTFTLYVLDPAVAGNSCVGVLAMAAEIAPLLKDTEASIKVMVVRNIDLQNDRVIEAMKAKNITALPALLISGSAFVGKRRILEELQYFADSLSQADHSQPDAKGQPDQERDDWAAFNPVEFDMSNSDDSDTLMSKMGYDD